MAVLELPPTLQRPALLDSHSLHCRPFIVIRNHIMIDNGHVGRAFALPSALASSVGESILLSTDIRCLLLFAVLSSLSSVILRLKVHNDRLD